ncbi:MAG: hypothetical protein ACK2UH_02830, partial [Candidatus Promineifilaceae bacterium]
MVRWERPVYCCVVGTGGASVGCSVGGGGISVGVDVGGCGIVVGVDVGGAGVFVGVDVDGAGVFVGVDVGGTGVLVDVAAGREPPEDGLVGVGVAVIRDVGVAVGKTMGVSVNVERRVGIPVFLRQQRSGRTAQAQSGTVNDLDRGQGGVVYGKFYHNYVFFFMVWFFVCF